MRADQSEPGRGGTSLADPREMRVFLAPYKILQTYRQTSCTTFLQASARPLKLTLTLDGAMTLCETRCTK